MAVVINYFAELLLLLLLDYHEDYGAPLFLFRTMDEAQDGITTES